MTLGQTAFLIFAITLISSVFVCLLSVAAYERLGGRAPKVERKAPALLSHAARTA